MWAHRSSEKHRKSCPNRPKMGPKIIKNDGLEGSGALRGGSGSHVGAQGRPEAPTCPKSTFEVPLGTPIWEAIFGTFRDFAVFFWRCFLEGRFGWVRGAIWSGFWVDFRWICRRLSLGFLWWGEPRQMSFGCIICYTKGMSAFATSFEKMRNL